MTNTQIIAATTEQLEATFTEWRRRYLEDPEGFQRETDMRTDGTPESYGEVCVPYFLEILSEQQGVAG